VLPSLSEICVIVPTPHRQAASDSPPLAPPALKSSRTLRGMNIRTPNERIIRSSGLLRRSLTDVEAVQEIGD
jgi:hypothetical protein